MKTMKFPIDLSMLTEEEIDQFRQDPSTLFEGDTDVSLYLRFSSERQREQSIEGQLRDCRTFCKLNSYRITAIYVDRATTARKDVEKRVHFQEMIRDSEKKPWEYVVVWKLDRFARTEQIAHSSNPAQKERRKKSSLLLRTFLRNRRALSLKLCWRVWPNFILPTFRRRSPEA